MTLAKSQGGLVRALSGGMGLRRPGNIQVKKCSDGQNAFIVSPSVFPNQRAFWGNTGSLEKCYVNNPIDYTQEAASDPAVLAEDWHAVNGCGDLTGWPVSDDFSGVSPNTGIVGDANNLARWSGQSGWTVVGGRWRNNSDYEAYAMVSVTGAFTLTWNWNQLSNPGGDSRAYVVLAYARPIASGNYVGIGWARQNPSVPGFFSVITNTQNQYTTPSLTSSFTITRNGSNLVQTKYGSTVLGSKTMSGTLTYLGVLNNGIASNEYWNIVLVDGSGNPIYKTPNS